MKYAIDGLFLTQRITGIQRYAYEIIEELDRIVEKDSVEIIVPESQSSVPAYNNIRLVKYGKSKGILWEQSDYARYLRKNKRLAICLCNVAPLLYPFGIAAIHDISCKVNPQFFISKRDRASALWHRINYYCVAKSKMQIITVSNFSKNEISSVYDVSMDRIKVINPSWQHIDKIKEAEDALPKYNLKHDGYFFAMATMMPNKNFKWVEEAAKNNPGEIFVVAGLNKTNIEGQHPNLKLIGYVSDEYAKTLMANCKAFIMPTLYEGFGLPPLEAAAAGAKSIIISDLQVLHEVYGNYANYIDPHGYPETLKYNDNNDLPQLLSNYSWKKSAIELKLMMENQQ